VDWRYKGAEIQRVSAQYRDSILPQQTMYKWTDIFKSDQTSVTDEHSAFPSTLIIRSTIEQVHMLILNNRRITIDEVANQLQISYCHKESSSVDFSFIKFVWVPKQFTEWHIVIVWTSVINFGTSILKRAARF
jgi:hypothetical protein